MGELYVWPQMCAFLVFGACLKQHAELEKAAMKTDASLEELKWMKCETTTKRSPAGHMSQKVLHALTDVAKVQISIQEDMNVFCRTYVILMQNLKVHVTASFLLTNDLLGYSWSSHVSCFLHFSPLFLPSSPFPPSLPPHLNYLNISHLCLITPHSSLCI